MDQASWHAGFLACLSPQYRTKLLGVAQAFRFPKDAVVFREGDPSLYLYIVKTGHVALEVSMPGRGRATLTTVGPGDVFSWSAVVEPRIETATARAMEDVEVVGVKSGVIQDLCWEDLEMGVELYRTLAEVISARLTATRLQVLDVYAVGPPK